MRKLDRGLNLVNLLEKDWRDRNPKTDVVAPAVGIETETESAAHIPPFKEKGAGAVDSQFVSDSTQILKGIVQQIGIFLP